MQLVYIAIALLVVIIVIWLAVQPKQGAQASNAPDDGPDDGPALLPKPQEPSLTSTPVRRPSQSVDYELPEDELPEDELDLSAGPTPAGAVTAQVRTLMEQGQKIEAMKAVRAATECGLKEAKAYVETFPHLGPLPNVMPSMEPSPSGDSGESDVTAQVRTLMERGRKIEAIKLVRAATGCGLKESKDYVETFPRLGPLPDCAMPSMANHPEAAAAIDREQVWALMEQGQKIKAIKLVREATGWGLRDAKAYVEQMPSHHSLMEGATGAEPPITSDALVTPFDLERYTVNDRLQMLLQQKRKVSAVKLVKRVAGVSLKDAVAYVEAYPDVDPLPVTERGPICDRIRDLLDQQLIMAAAELVQQRTGMEITEALEYLKQNFAGNYPF